MVSVTFHGVKICPWEQQKEWFMWLAVLRVMSIAFVEERSHGEAEILISCSKLVECFIAQRLVFHSSGDFIECLSWLNLSDVFLSYK